MAKNRPEFVTTKMLEFIDGLRESTVTNMYGATPYIREEFPDLDMDEAIQLLRYWMDTFRDKENR